MPAPAGSFLESGKVGGGAVWTDGSVYGTPLWVPPGTAVDRIGCQISTLGTSGAVVRLGILGVDSRGAPNSVLLDAGTVDATSTGQKMITISTTVSGLVWLAGVVQGAAATPPQAYGVATALFPIPAAAADGNTYLGARLATGITGALSTATFTVTILTSAIHVFLRAA